jgi:superfamily II DNA/RNA helicase
LFSATLDRDVDALVKRFLKNPITHSLENEKSRSADMLHHVLLMDQGHKDVIATQIAAREGRTIFFVRTKHGADKLADKMLNAGVPVGVLHGGKSQGQRTRVLASFKDGRATALVATDVAARGIHVDDVSLVVHVDAPADHKDYLHRAGRTARAGATGVVVTLATHKQKKGVYGITNRAGVKLAEVNVRPSDPELIRITGAQEPSGIPIVVPAEKPSRGSRDRGDRSGFRRGHSGNFKKRSEGGGRHGDENASEGRSERPARFSKGDKPVRNFRGAAFSAPAKPTYETRPERSERPAREERPPRSEKAPFRAAQHGKPDRFAKSDRPAKSDRFKPARSESSERPSKFAGSSRNTWRAETTDSAKPTGKSSVKKKSAGDKKPAPFKSTEGRSFREEKKYREEKKSESSRTSKPGAKKFAPKKAAAKKSAGKPVRGGSAGAKKFAGKKVAGKKPRTK